MAEAGLDGGVQRLTDVVRDGGEGAVEARDLIVGVERVGVEGVA